MLGKKMILIIGVAILTGCSATNIPSGSLPGAGKLHDFPKGGWIVAEKLQVTGNPDQDFIRGELIALEDSMLYILTPDSMVVASASAIRRATVYVWRSHPEAYALWTVLAIIPNIAGAIATGYGEFLLLAIPMIVVGTTMTAVEGASKSNQIIYPQKHILGDLRPYCRFPQGIPESVPLSAIH